MRPTFSCNTCGRCPCRCFIPIPGPPGATGPTGPTGATGPAGPINIPDPEAIPPCSIPVSNGQVYEAQPWLDANAGVDPRSYGFQAWPYPLTPTSRLANIPSNILDMMRLDIYCPIVTTGMFFSNASSIMPAGPAYAFLYHSSGQLLFSSGDISALILPFEVFTVPIPGGLALEGLYYGGILFTAGSALFSGGPLFSADTVFPKTLQIASQEAPFLQPPVQVDFSQGISGGDAPWFALL